MGRYLKLLALIAIVFFLVTFGVKNSQPIHLSYYLDTVEVDLPLYLLIYTAVVIGIMIGMGFGIYRRVDLQRRIRKVEREGRKKEEREATTTRLSTSEP
jgi:uncharacterized integral membrane protein